MDATAHCEPFSHGADIGVRGIGPRRKLQAPIKDVTAVVVAAEKAGLSRRVARLEPLICIKARSKVPNGLLYLLRESRIIFPAEVQRLSENDVDPARSGKVVATMEDSLNSAQPNRYDRHAQL